MKRPLYLLLLPLALIAGRVPACETLSGPPSPPPPPTTLQEAEQRWTAQDLNDYRYRFTRTCFCSPPRLDATVTVRSDTIAAIHGVKANGALVQSTERLFDRGMARTIDEFFGLIRDAAHRRIDSVAVTYDARQGYPASLFVDPLQAMSSEEVTYTIHGVTALPPRARD